MIIPAGALYSIAKGIGRLGQLAGAAQYAHRSYTLKVLRFLAEIIMITVRVCRVRRSKNPGEDIAEKPDTGDPVIVNGCLCCVREDVYRGPSMEPSEESKSFKQSS